LQLGRDLGVRAVLSGSVRRTGEDLTIQGDLAEVEDGAELWGHRYSLRAREALAVQTEIAERVAAALRPKSTGSDGSRLALPQPPRDAEAYRLYLHGRYFWNKRTQEGIRKAIALFEQAIDRDPSFALGYSGLADCYILLGMRWTLPRESYPRAKAAARKALAIDDNLAEAHASLGYVTMRFDWNWPGAEAEFRRAIELDPGYPTAHQWYGILLLVLGRYDEAIAEVERAVDLDPFSIDISTDLGVAFFYARRYDRAIEQLRRTIEMDPNFAYAHFFLGLVYAAKGLYRDALDEFKRAAALAPEIGAYRIHLAWAYALAGDTAEARRLLASLEEEEKTRFINPVWLARVYESLGMRDRAFERLQQAYVERIGSLIQLGEPMFDGLRSDPRFTELLERLHLSP
jgi:tetratricopeptide (TPR) repeat protein